MAGFLDYASAIAAGLSPMLSAWASKRANDQNRQIIKDTNQTNLTISRETNAANQRINQQSLDAQMRLQQMAQGYNSPVTQASLLRAAGLNPAFSDSMAGSIGAGSVPSSIPNQPVTMQPPLNNYSDTYIDSGLRAIHAAVEAYQKAEQGLGDSIDNMTKHESNVVDINKRKAEIDNILANTKVSRAERKRLESERKMLDLNIDIINSAKGDIIESHRVQNEMARQNTLLAIEKINETKEAILTARLARQISKDENSREWSALKASNARMYAEAFALEQQGKLTNKEIGMMADKYANLQLENKLLYQSYSNNNITFPILKKQLEQELRQAKQDYTNPFKYVIGGMSGFGAATLKTFAK